MDIQGFPILMPRDEYQENLFDLKLKKINST